MVLSMVLQAVYNIVDTIFVSHMENGATAVLALTDSYSIQLLIVAVGVGTGIGINALLSKTLGERNFEKASCIAGNGIFLAVYLCGFSFVRHFRNQSVYRNAGERECTSPGNGGTVSAICCIGSFGSIGYTVYERFLQGTGRTNLSTIAQITGALLNIILDPIFIFGLDMGVTGAAAATVVGQLASLGMAMLFHYRWDKEIRRDWKHVGSAVGTDSWNLCHRYSGCDHARAAFCHGPFRQSCIWNAGGYGRTAAGSLWHLL